jgi:hypothetical protein
MAAVTDVFLPVGADSFRRHIRGTMVQISDTGHFALETHAKEIAPPIRDLMSNSYVGELRGSWGRYFSY